MTGLIIEIIILLFVLAVKGFINEILPDKKWKTGVEMVLMAIAYISAVIITINCS